MESVILAQDVNINIKILQVTNVSLDQIANIVNNQMKFVMTLCLEIVKRYIVTRSMKEIQQDNAFMEEYLAQSAIERAIITNLENAIGINASLNILIHLLLLVHSRASFVNSAILEEKKIYLVTFIILLMENVLKVTIVNTPIREYLKEIVQIYFAIRKNVNFS